MYDHTTFRFPEIGAPMSVQMTSYDHKIWAVTIYLKKWLLTGLSGLPAAPTAIPHDQVLHSLYLEEVKHFRYHTTRPFYQEVNA